MNWRRTGTALAVAVALSLTTLAAAGARTTAPQRGTSIDEVVAVHEAMDKLWTDHVAWTRSVIVDFFANSPSLTPDLARLLRNQTDIGNAIKPYYGVAAANKLSALLHTHIQEAVPVLTAAPDGNNAALKKALATWYANAHQIAVFLSKADPHSWPLHDTDMMMKDHLQWTTNKAVAELKHDWGASIADYDNVRSEILGMASTLADGLLAQFPSRFA